MTLKFTNFMAPVAAITFVGAIGFSGMTPASAEVASTRIIETASPQNAAPHNAAVADFFAITAIPATTKTHLDIADTFFGDYVYSSRYTYDFLAQGNAQAAEERKLETVHDFGAIATVPEPEIWAMFIFGMVAVGFGLRRRRRLNDEVGYDKIV